MAGSAEEGNQRPGLSCIVLKPFNRETQRNTHKYMYSTNACAHTHTHTHTGKRICVHNNA